MDRRAAFGRRKPEFGARRRDSQDAHFKYTSRICAYLNLGSCESMVRSLSCALKHFFSSFILNFADGPSLNGAFEPSANLEARLNPSIENAAQNINHLNAHRGSVSSLPAGRATENHD